MKKVFAFLLAVSMLLTLAACGGAQDSAKSPATGSAKPDTPANTQSAAQDTAQSGTSEPTRGGVLKVAATEPDSMLVYRWRNGGTALQAIYEGLMVFDETGTPQPFLAESVTGDVDSLTYTIQLKPGITFHDGSELTAEVCKWNLDMYKAEGVLSSSFFSNVESVEVTGDYTVVIHLSAWDSLLPSALCRNPGYMESKLAHDTYGADYCAMNPVGTGPFKFVRYEQGVSISVEKYADYWQGEPYLDGIDFVVYTTPLVAQAALENGDIHVWQASDYSIAKYLKDEGFNVIQSAIPYVCYAISFNCVGDDPLADIRVRQAIAYAIDRDAIGTILEDEYGIVTNQYVPAGSVFFNDAIQGYPYNVEKAKELLKDAGYPNGFSTSVVVYDNMSSNDICLILRDQLAEVGITLEVKSVDIGSYLLNIDGWGSGMIAHPMTLDNGIDSQLAAIFRQGLSSGLGVTSFLHPDDLNENILNGLNSTGDESVQYFQEAMRLIFDEYCMVKAIAVNSRATVESPSVHDTGIGAVSSYSATLWKAWLEQD